jgi:hypothetical protein
VGVVSEDVWRRHPDLTVHVKPVQHAQLIAELRRVSRKLIA